MPEIHECGAALCKNKPIIVVKSGRTTESAKAAASHTGANQGEDMVYDAAFKRAGIVRVKDISDLFNCAEAIGKQPLPKGPNLAIITNAGGAWCNGFRFNYSLGGETCSI